MGDGGPHAVALRDVRLARRARARQPVRAKVEAGAVDTTVLAGLDVQRLDVGLQQTFGGAPSLDLFAPDYEQPVDDAPDFADSETKQSQTGLYLQGQFDVAERLILSLNGRYDRATTETSNASPTAP